MGVVHAGLLSSQRHPDAANEQKKDPATSGEAKGNATSGEAKGRSCKVRGSKRKTGPAGTGKRKMFRVVCGVEYRGPAERSGSHLDRGKLKRTTSPP